MPDVFSVVQTTVSKRLDSLLRRSKRLGYCSDDVPVVADLFNTADDDFFHRVKTNSDHVYQSYLPDPTNIPYQPRNLSHNITLINKTKFLNDTDFIIRMLYKYSYWLSTYTRVYVWSLAYCYTLLR